MKLLQCFALALICFVTAQRPKINGYSQFPGYCDGRDSRTLATNFKNCADLCTADDRCNGFDYNFAAGSCGIRAVDCDPGAIRPDNDRLFYRKGEISCDNNNQGKEFVFGFMSNRAARPQKSDLEMFVTHEHDFPITISLRMKDGINNKEMVVQPNSIETFLVPSDYKMTDNEQGGIVVEAKGIRLLSEQSFVMYGVNKDFFTTDAWLGLPANVLGQKYFAACHHPAFYTCEFAIAALTDNTEVTITLPRVGAKKTANGIVKDQRSCDQVEWQGRRYSNGESFKVSLREYEVLQLQDGCDLTGTKIETNQAVSFFSGNARTNVGDGTNTRDHLVENFPPVTAWGSDCFATATPQRTVGDFWTLTAAEDDTVIQIHNFRGAVETVRLGEGESYRFQNQDAGKPMYIQANNGKQFLAVQYVHSQLMGAEDADPAMILCTPSGQFGFGYTFLTPKAVATEYQNFVSVVIKDGQQNGLLLDGAPARDFLDRWETAGQSGLVVNSIKVAHGSHHLGHTDRVANFGAYIYGAGDRESYGFPTGMCVRQIKCEGTAMRIADNQDNDCDGVVDEELCGDGLDDDGDGRIDEDCHSVRKEVPVNDKCWDVRQAIACYDSQLELRCPTGQVKLIDAHFGRIGYKDEYSCNAGNPVDEYGREINCGLVDIYWPLLTECKNKAECSMAVNLFTMGNIRNPNTRCQLCNQYAWVHYTCMETRDFPSYNFAGRMGAELPDRYSGSSFSYGSVAIPGTCAVASSAATYSYPMNSCPGCSAAARLATADMTSPSSARFSVTSTHAWCPAFCDRTNAWIEIDMAGHYRVTGYMIQGRRSEEQWAVTIGLAFSSDRVTWNELRNPDGSWKVFEANKDARQIKWCTINDYDITARYARAFILSYSGQPCLHFDITRKDEHQGCEQMTVANSNFKQEPGRRGTQSTVKCNHGWQTSGGETSYIVSCDGSGRWQSADWRPCNKAVNCPDIPTVRDALHNGKNSFVGAEVTYQCVNNRRLEGSATIRCQNDATWSQQAPRCV